MSSMRGSPNQKQLWDPSRGIRFAQKRPEPRVVRWGFLEAIFGYSTNARPKGALSSEEPGQKDDGEQRDKTWFGFWSKKETIETRDGSTTAKSDDGSATANTGKEQDSPLRLKEETNSSVSLRTSEYRQGSTKSEVVESAVSVSSVTEETNPADGAEAAKQGTEKAEAPKAEEPAKVLASPPLTDLEFNISSEAFWKARKAPPGSAESFWSYAMYRGPVENGVEKRVKVHYCKSRETMETVCQHFLDEKVLGFDIEWITWPTKLAIARKSVSLIQLASPSRIALFHTAVFPTKDDDLVAPSFRKIMEDPEISKVGVHIKADCTRVRKYLGVDTKGIFELSHLYKLVKFSKSGQVELINKYLVNLAKQVEEHLGLPLFKGDDVRSSDWTKPLTMSQIIYSASDAYAGVQLYHVLEKERESLDPCPPRPYHAELNRPIRLAQGVTISTEDESTEAEESGSDTASTGQLSQLSTSLAREIEESLKVESEASGAESETPTKVAKVTNKAEPITSKTWAGRPIIQTIPKNPRTVPQTSKPWSGRSINKSIPKDPRIAEAELWLRNYRKEKTTAVSVPPCALRGYRIWYDTGLNPEGVAAVLRAPPLQTQTVVGYILDSIRLEDLPYNKSRLKSEVLTYVDEGVWEYRCKGLSKELLLETEHETNSDSGRVMNTVAP